MDTLQQLTIKRALETLDSVAAGLPKVPLFAQVERMLGVRLTTAEADDAVAKMIEKAWVYDYKNKLTDAITYAITEAGRVAMMGL